MSLLSHDRYQYDSLILSTQTWAYPRQHLQQLLWCVVSVCLNLPEVHERKLYPLRYYANCVSTMLTVLILHNVESICFFCSNPVYVLLTLSTLLVERILSSIRINRMTTKCRWKFRICTATNDLTLYSFSSLYIFVTWGWPHWPKHVVSLIKLIKRQLCFDVPTPSWF